MRGLTQSIAVIIFKQINNKAKIRKVIDQSSNQMILLYLMESFNINITVIEFYHHDEIIFIMTEQTYFVEMKEEHIDEATAVLTRSFLQLNDIWKTHANTYQQIFPILRGKIIPALKSGWSFVLLKNNKVIGVSIQYDLVQYLKMPSMPSDLQLFKILGQTGRNLDKKLDYSRIKPGQVSYGLYGVMDPSEAGKKHAFKFWWNQFAIGKAAGWHYYYSRISSPVSLKLLLRLGAEILADVDVVGSEGKQKMWMIRIDLKKPFPSYTQLTNLMIGKNKSKAKL